MNIGQITQIFLDVSYVLKRIKHIQRVFKHLQFEHKHSSLAQLIKKICMIEFDSEFALEDNRSAIVCSLCVTSCIHIFFIFTTFVLSSGPMDENTLLLYYHEQQ